MALSNNHIFSRFITNASAAAVTAAFTIIACGSFAALIFTGPLQPFVAPGIWIGLFTALIVGSMVSMTSSFVGAIAIPQDRVAPILALLATGVAAGMGTATPADKFVGVLAAIAMVSLITGLFLFLLGRLRLGNLIRYIPYPVIGGFLAGSGWLLVRGALQVMTGQTLSPAKLPLFFNITALAQWLPGAIFGSLLFVVLRRWRNPLTMPLMLFAAIGLFYLWMSVAGVSLIGARSHGWLPDFPAGDHAFGSFSPLHIIQSTPWPSLLHAWPILITILLTSVVSILLTASALELADDAEIDLNRELRSAGLATFLAGLGGGMIGFHSLSLSRLALSMGARSRWVGISSAVICGLALCLGPAVVSYVPQYVCGGLLFFLGLTFLWEWVYEARRTLTHLDYAVVLLILAVVGAFGYPEGVGVGIVAAVVLFIHNYSRVDVVTDAFSGTELHSTVDRSVPDSRFLREQGGEIYALRLQGFIFFGTADHLLHEVRSRIANAQLPALKYVIMDFRRVTGLDSSAIFSLSKVRNLARKHGFHLLMSHLSPAIALQLEKGGLSAAANHSFKLLPDLDHALEWCENELLASTHAPPSADQILLAEQLKDGWPVVVEPRLLLPYLDFLEVPAGQHLIRQTEPSDSLYFIESGRVTVRLEFAGGRILRLRSMGAGTVVGEIGLFLGGPRTASVITERPCTVYRLTAAALERMSEENPPLALALYRYIICVLGERLTSNSKLLHGLIE